MQKLVSVIIPVYQAEQYLDRCIRSITGQTYKNLEILLIDDGSTDGSLEICRKFAGQDNRIKVFHQSNQGVSSTRNFGLRQMTGDYVLFSDADDYINTQMVEEMIGAATATHADVVICGFCMIYEDGSPNKIFQVNHNFAGSLQEFVAAQLLECYDKLLIHTQSNKLCSTKLIHEHQIAYHPEMAINEDVCLSLEMLMHSKRIVTLHECYMNYWQYRRPQSLVTRFNENGVETCFILLRTIQECLEKGKAEKQVRHEINNRMLTHICGFAGLPYYRSDYTNKQCYGVIRALVEKADFQILLKQTKAYGTKNIVARFLLTYRLSFLYHLLCMVLYRKKRVQYHQNK